ncbi:MAG: NAAT family transporter [Verrucomicrobiota bacterium]|nr:NAAT family transporter [Verrucomicrobiota bacterium]
MDFIQFINSFVALLVICNPLSVLPAVLRITQHQTLAEKRRTGLVSAFAVLIILIGTTWVGSILLTILGIQIAAFQVAGGLVILMMAFSMLQAEESTIKQSPQEGVKRQDTGAIVPLAIPLIAGPGAMSEIIVKVSQFPGFLNLLIISAMSLLVSIVMGALLYFASPLERLLGENRINVINRIGGLILAAMAIQTIAKGIKGFMGS